MSHSAMRPEIALRARGLVKRFAGVAALRGVDFELAAGEVHALCGENGAGKSTLIKILAGVIPHGAYEGEVHVAGEPARFRSVRESEARGIAVIHQELALVDEMTVAENIFLGHEPTRYGFIDHQRMYGAAQRLLDRFDLDIAADRQVGDLGIGQKQLVEIAKAIERDSTVLILDEPSAALTGGEVEVLLQIVRELRQRGVACLYISHKLDEVFAIADRITVLRDGDSVGRFDTQATQPDVVVRHMVGREIAELYPRRDVSPGEVLLEVEDLCVADSDDGPPRLADIRFSVRAGEVLGIGGLMGAGRSELLHHVFGAWGRRRQGSVRIAGRPLAASPRACLRQGVALVCEDRKRHGLVLGQTLAFNLSLSSIAGLARRGWIDSDREMHGGGGARDTLRIVAPHLQCAVETLSGGNQQKVVLGKALMSEPRVLLLDEPTRGIDVGAKQEIYRLIRELTSGGLAVVMVSSELPELMGMSDRILMLAGGRQSGIFASGDVSAETLLAAAMATTAGCEQGRTA